MSNDFSISSMRDTRANAEAYAKRTGQCPFCAGRRGISILEIGCDTLTCHTCEFECDRERESYLEMERRRGGGGAVDGQELPYVPATKSKPDLDPLWYVWVMCFAAILVAAILWSCK